MPPRALFIGLATWDSIALVPRFPGADERVAADAIIEAGGGPAATAAVACAKLGVASAFIGAIGDDRRGARIRAGLRTAGVDVSALRIVPGLCSPAAVIIAAQDAGTRAICPLVPPPLSVGAGDVAPLLRNAAIIHADQLGWPILHHQLLHHQLGIARSGGPLLSVDAGNPIENFNAGRVDLFAPTLDFLAARFGAAPPAALLARAAAECGGWIIATDGAAGAYGCVGGKIWHVPAHPVVAISTLGAGDVFHGALVAARIHGLGPVEATAYAGIAAALSCRGIDGRSAIPSHDEVMAALPALVARTQFLAQETANDERCLANPA